MEEATAATGLDDFGGSEFLEPLGLVCAGLRQDIITDFGRDLLSRDCVAYLSNRLRMLDWAQQHPEVTESPIAAPIVILGLPRTGTTVLSYLLDHDPRWRSLLNWEAVDSVPPAEGSTLRSDPRCTEKLEFQRSVLPIIDPPPPHWEWADGPTECTFLLAQDFKTIMWDARFPNPAYREYIEQCDMTSAYRYHRLGLQVLQSRAPGRWVLKMPAHAYFIETVLATYPDAQFIWTHRDPATCVASFMNLLAFSHALAIPAADRKWIAETIPPRLLDQATRPMTALADRDVHHVHYQQMMADPLGEIARIYDWLGAPLEADVTTAMGDWLVADPLERSRVSSYSLADFEMNAATVRRSFADYIDHFGVAAD